MNMERFWYDVYDNRTNEIIYSGEYCDVEDYIENPGRYTVVWRINGQVIN